MLVTWNRWNLFFDSPLQIQRFQAEEVNLKGFQSVKFFWFFFELDIILDIRMSANMIGVTVGK